MDDGLRKERAICAKHGVPSITSGSHRITISYAGFSDRHGELKLRVDFHFRLVDDSVETSAEIWHDDVTESFDVVEVQFPIVGGIVSVGEDALKDYLVWPAEGPALKLMAPLSASLDSLRSTAPYQQPDEDFTCVSLIYPRGGPKGAAMSWAGLFNESCGIYVGSHDTTGRTTTMNLERTVKDPSLSLGFGRFPFLKAGESWKSPLSVIALEQGDWHAGARRYRRWAESTWWKAPQPPDWVKRFQGWLRIFCMQEHGDVQLSFEEVPALVDQVKASGLETVFLLGWNRGGWSRNWPDYVAEERLGGPEGLRQALKEAHARGGRVAAFVSYSTIDPATPWYREVGHRLSARSQDGLETRFPEVYSDLGTWRRIAIGNKPNVVVCASNPEWKQLMNEVGVRLIRDGFDAVLYDAPSFNFLCFGENHGHERPDEAFAGVMDHLAELRESLRSENPEAAIFIENAQDRLHSSVDLAQPCPSPSIDRHFWELYRYTFPECIVTNREFGLDENRFEEKIRLSLLFGFRFDMSVYRCRGTLNDVPAYAEGLREACALRDALPDLLFEGLFRDEDGLSLSSGLVGKVYEGKKRHGVVIWNRCEVSVPLDLSLSGRKPSGWHALGEPRQSALPDQLKPGELGVALFEPDL